MVWYDEKVGHERKPTVTVALTKCLVAVQRAISLEFCCSEFSASSHIPSGIQSLWSSRRSSFTPVLSFSASAHYCVQLYQSHENSLTCLIVTLIIEQSYYRPATHYSLVSPYYECSLSLESRSYHLIVHHGTQTRSKTSSAHPTKKFMSSHIFNSPTLINRTSSTGTTTIQAKLQPTEGSLGAS